MKFLIYILVTFILLCTSCKSDVNNAISPSSIKYVNADGKKLQRTIVSVKPYEDKLGKKKFEEIRYNIGFVSAIEFIERKRQKIEEKDRKELMKESVGIFDIELMHSSRGILESYRNPLDQDQTIQYLSGNIVKDFKVEQGGIEYLPSAHHFENSQSKRNRIKLYIFFKDLDLKRKMRFVYHDRLFGAGMLNFGINKEK